MVATLRIENAEGAWQGTTYILALADDDQSDGDVVALSGSGTYEGSVALAEMRQDGNLCHWTLEDVIVERGVAQVPDLE